MGKIRESYPRYSTQKQEPVWNEKRVSNPIIIPLILKRHKRKIRFIMLIRFIGLMFLMNDEDFVLPEQKAP